MKLIKAKQNVTISISTQVKTVKPQYIEYIIIDISHMIINTNCSLLKSKLKYKCLKRNHS